MKPVRQNIALVISNIALNCDMSMRHRVSRSHKNLVNKMHMVMNDHSIKHRVNKGVFDDINKEKEKIP